MRGIHSISVALALVACSTDHYHSSTDRPGDASDSHGPTDSGSGGGSGSCDGGTAAAVCPLGAGTFTDVLGVSNPLQQLSLATEPSGEVLFGASQGGANTDVVHVSGAGEISAMGSTILTLPFGSLVASDASGDLYIAGSFTTAIDLGNGLVLTPQGNLDVFVAKLDANGHVIFARALGLCGDGVAAIAVGADGRIALSGTAMGTAVLSASGDIALQFAETGQVAFDTLGNLVIAGSQTDSAYAFLEKYDASGTLVFRTAFEGKGVRISGLVVDTSDAIIFVGDATAYVDFFGTDITARFASESGRFTGAFAVKTFSNRDPVFVKDLGIVEANGVAVDANGQIFIAAAITGNTGFFRYMEIVKIDVHAVVSMFDFGGNANGRVVAIAVDACGSVLAGLVRQATPDPQSEIDTVVQKLAL